jgi:hypothetical protein
MDISVIMSLSVMMSLNLSRFDIKIGVKMSRPMYLKTHALPKIE